MREFLRYLWCGLKGHDWQRVSWNACICRKRCGAVKELF